MERALPQVLGTCRAPEGQMGPGRAGREETSSNLTKKKKKNAVIFYIEYIFCTQMVQYLNGLQNSCVAIENIKAT